MKSLVQDLNSAHQEKRKRKYDGEISGNFDAFFISLYIKVDDHSLRNCKLHYHLDGTSRSGNSLPVTESRLSAKKFKNNNLIPSQKISLTRLVPLKVKEIPLELDFLFLYPGKKNSRNCIICINFYDPQEIQYLLLTP